MTDLFAALLLADGSTAAAAAAATMTHADEALS